jgi:hypothetical protein
MVTASVATGVVPGEGLGLGDGFGDGDVTSVLDGACAAPLSAGFRPTYLSRSIISNAKTRWKKWEGHTEVERVVADEAGTTTVEDSAVDELAWTELCADTTDVNVGIDSPKAGVVSTAEVEEEKEEEEEEEEEEEIGAVCSRCVLGWVLTDEDGGDEEVCWLGEAPPIVPDGAMLKAM